MPRGRWDRLPLFGTCSAESTEHGAGIQGQLPGFGNWPFPVRPLEESYSDPHSGNQAMLYMKQEVFPKM